MRAHVSFSAAKAKAPSIVKLLTPRLGLAGRPSVRHGKLAVKAVQAGFPGDGSLPQDKDSKASEGNPLEQDRLASSLAASTSAASSALAGPLAALKYVVKAYNHALIKHPVATKALTSFIGFAIGDRIAQSVGGAPFDAFR